ncbi:MAG: sulfate transporter CysZ [gamma proteobacterium symbiont of Bathyaustriella thionipta]|nr:sulfate transporter CysZ [gamma proteobacterium symbiont of Bathyaustriella thionipta]MCU7950347.1 sulfate transporter CysZ [gamma proteobacterium symbiont of Bathyaustriella thionipta]MCU7954971.1 sulfate transporter CysZ [gamma proteobacterium symbiont of Bathyaustriella thionipta]MCU7956852.1 sulfate transporter CysZ [gamma proteobacterium symbiont of Bathyaustriella thionipta]MCU7967892.1 sulfate transporter CysZ [gamma proteobacterium symbiont of Bathyaustriella thionipta]
MAQSNNPISGISYLLKAIPMLTQKGIKSYVIIPLVINILFFSIGVYFGFAYFGEYMDKMLDTSGLWSWVAAIVDMIKPLLYIIFGMALLILIFYTFSLVANIVASPFNSLLAEATEKHLTGKVLNESDGFKQIMKDLVPTIMMELRKLIYMVLWSIPFLILLFVIPVVGPIIWFLFTAWMMSLQYMDYPMANHKLKFHEQRALQRKQRLFSLGFGGATMGASMIPFVNFVVMPTAVIAATMIWVDQYSDAKS